MRTRAPQCVRICRCEVEFCVHWKKRQGTHQVGAKDERCVLFHPNERVWMFQCCAVCCVCCSAAPSRIKDGCIASDTSKLKHVGLEREGARDGLAGGDATCDRRRRSDAERVGGLSNIGVEKKE